ncbi:hypothetical protein K438DRAFT_1846480 [Mycena galopus ATCC 62051]|nr:hypothetical protein K438DRAFT_1846480 [Mycena galopus ATCC 62051]
MRPGGDKEEMRAFAFLLAFFGFVVRDLLRVVRGTGTQTGIGAPVHEKRRKSTHLQLHLITQPRTCPCRPLLKFFSVHSLLPPLLLFTFLSTPTSPPPRESPRGVLLYEPAFALAFAFVDKQRRARQALQIRKPLWCCLHVQVCCSFGLRCSRRWNSRCGCGCGCRCRNRMCRRLRPNGTDAPRERNHIVLAQRAPKVAQENDEQKLTCAPLHRARRSNNNTIPLS